MMTPAGRDPGFSAHGPVIVRAGKGRRRRAGHGGLLARDLRGSAALQAHGPGRAGLQACSVNSDARSGRTRALWHMALGGRHLGVRVRPHRVGAPTQIYAAGDGALSGDVGCHASQRRRHGDRRSCRGTPLSAYAVCEGMCLRLAGVELYRSAGLVWPLYPTVPGTDARLQHRNLRVGADRIRSIFRMPKNADGPGRDHRWGRRHLCAIRRATSDTWGEAPFFTPRRFSPLSAILPHRRMRQSADQASRR